MSASLIPSPYELAFRLRAARQAAREGNGEVLGKALAGLRTALEDYVPASDPVDVALGALAVRQVEEADASPDDLRLVRRAVEALEPAWIDSEAWEPPPAPEPAASVTAGGRVFPAFRRGELSILTGSGGAGKSFLALGIAKTAAGGGGHHAGFDVADGPALVLSSEGGAAQAVRRLRRIEGHGAVQVLASPRPVLIEEDGRLREGPMWPTLARAVREIRPALAVIDPALAFLDLESANAARPVRRALERLAALADSEGVAVLALHHTGKAFRYGARQLASERPEAVAAHALAGSREWTDTPRAALVMYGTGEGGAELLSVKSNAGETGWAVRLRKRLTTHASTRGETTVMHGWERVERLTPEARADANRKGSGTASPAPADDNPFAGPGEV